MKKKTLNWIFCIIAYLLISLLVVLCFKKVNEKKVVENTIHTLHNFCLFSVDNSYELCTELLPKKPMIILFMHPECDFCQEEIKELKNFQTELQNISVLLITSASLKQASDFYSNQNLEHFPNIQLLLDEDLNISNRFDINIIPTVFLYDKDKKLRFKHKGEIKVEALIERLTEK